MQQYCRGIVITLALLSTWSWGLNGSFEIEVLPVFSAKTISGDRVTHHILSNGGIVTFFRSGCGYCLLEFPVWAEVKKHYPDLMMVLVTHNEPHWRVKQFLDHHGNPFDVVIDDSDKMIWRMFGASQTPETFLFDNNLKVKGHFGYLGKQSRPLFNALEVFAA